MNGMWRYRTTETLCLILICHAYSRLVPVSKCVLWVRIEAGVSTTEIVVLCVCKLCRAFDLLSTYAYSSFFGLCCFWRVVVYTALAWSRCFTQCPHATHCKQGRFTQTITAIPVDVNAPTTKCSSRRLGRKRINPGQKAINRLHRPW